MEGQSAVKRAGRVVRPWSSFSSSDATPDNFPALRHFFPCEDGAGTYALRDVVAGVGFYSDTYTAPDQYSVRPGWHDEASGHNRPVSGRWNIDRSMRTLALCCMQRATGYPSIGVGSSVPEINGVIQPGEEFIFSSGFYVLSVSSGGVSIASPGIGLSTAVPTMSGGFYFPGDTLTGIYTDATGACVQQTPVSLATLSLGPDLVMAPADSMGGDNIAKLYGIAIFQFESSFPTDIAKAVEWMRAEWVRGNKAIYPGWRGVR